MVQQLEFMWDIIILKYLRYNYLLVISHLHFSRPDYPIETRLRMSRHSPKSVRVSKSLNQSIALTALFFRKKIKSIKNTGCS